jgi:hypothetical protein
MFGKGPSLPGVVSKLTNPLLTVLSTGESNDNWGTMYAPLREELTEANLGPSQSLESALWPTFAPGTYTVQLQGVSGGTGVGLIEFYEC